MDVLDNTVQTIVSQIPGGTQSLQLVVLLLASKYALRSRLLELIFANPIGSAILLWLAAYISFGYDTQTATYVAIFLWIADILLNFFFPPKEGFDIENRNIYPGCMNMTYEEMLQHFGGDKERLRRAMFNAVNTNYTSPALAATQLINKGFYLGEECKLPPSS